MTELKTAYIKTFHCQNGDSSSVEADAKKALDGKKNTAADSGDNMIAVQFNPTQLTFSSSGGTGREAKEKASLVPGRNGKMEHVEVMEKTDTFSLKIPLIFDRSIYADSSVVPMVEGFMAIIKDPYVRRIAFCWGDLYYLGVVEHVSAEYEMFNEQGIPMRAKVDLDVKIK